MVDRCSRRTYVARLGTGATVGLTGCVSVPGVGPAEFRLEDGFETGLDAWSSAAAIGPEVEIEDFDWWIERTNDRSYRGNWSAAIFTEGRYDDGTAWLVRPIEIAPERAYTAQCHGYAWSQQESFNHLRDVVMYLGPNPPVTEEDFPPPGANSTGIAGAAFGGLREPLDQVAGWKRYRFTWQTPELDVERVYFAVGISVVWETDRTDFVDEIRVVLSERG